MSYDQHRQLADDNAVKAADILTDLGRQGASKEITARVAAAASNQATAHAQLAIFHEMRSQHLGNNEPAEE